MKQNQKNLEVIGKSRAGGSCSGDAGGRKVWLCQGHVVLDTVCWGGVLGKGCGSGGTGKQQERCCVFSHFPAFLNDAGL